MIVLRYTLCDLPAWLLSIQGILASPGFFKTTLGSVTQFIVMSHTEAVSRPFHPSPVAMSTSGVRRIRSDDQKICQNCGVQGGPGSRLMLCKGCLSAWYCVSQTHCQRIAPLFTEDFRDRSVRRPIGRRTNPRAGETSKL